jgi:hypothetical protein
MADITIKTASPVGVDCGFTAASAGGDKVLPGATLLVWNADASGKTVTIDVPGNTKYGQANPDITAVAVGAGLVLAFGPFPADLANPTDGKVAISYPGGVTNLKVAAISAF